MQSTASSVLSSAQVSGPSSEPPVFDELLDEDEDELEEDDELDELDDEVELDPPRVASVGKGSSLSLVPSPSESGLVGSVPSAHSWPLVRPSSSSSAVALSVAVRLP
jgi:hypothetical protein